MREIKKMMNKISYVEVDSSIDYLIKVVVFNIYDNKLFDYYIINNVFIFADDDLEDCHSYIITNYNFL